MKDLENDEVRAAVRQNYSQIARASSCGCGSNACCGNDVGGAVASKQAQMAGYSQEESNSVPEGANMGLGCGNPQAIAAMKQGEVILDLGSGGGFDCFLAARQVGAEGHVIGVDMTPEMVSKARANASKGGYANVEFRLGEIENLPVADNTVDAILSNCVINLSPDKPRVFAEAFRVLKAGGRLAISDIVATAGLSDEIKQDMTLLSTCVGGAALASDLEDMLHATGYERIRVVVNEASRSYIREHIAGSGAEDYVVSANIEAIKPN